MRKKAAAWAKSLWNRANEVWAKLDETPDAQADAPNPLRIFFFGAASLLAALAITPSVACGLYPLVTTADFGEPISADAAGVFVFVSTMFVGFYKLTDEFWRWQLRRAKKRKENYWAMGWYLAVLVALVGSIAVGLSCAEDPETEKSEGIEQNAELDTQD